MSTSLPKCVSVLIALKKMSLSTQASSEGKEILKENDLSEYLKENFKGK
jgi:hypothetical protein